MSEQTLKFGDIVVNRKEFHASKQAIALNLVNTNKTVVSDKFKHSNDGSKYFIDYLHDDDDVIRPSFITLPQMSGYIKYFDNSGKTMSFKTEDESVYLKYTEIWNKIKKSLNIEFHSQPIYDDKYIKTKVKTVSSMINTLFPKMKFQKKEIITFVLQQLVLIPCIKSRQEKLSSSLLRTMQIQNKKKKTSRFY